MARRGGEGFVMGQGAGKGGPAGGIATGAGMGFEAGEFVGTLCFEADVLGKPVRNGLCLKARGFGDQALGGFVKGYGVRTHGRN